MLERTRFEPSEVEPRIAERWLASGIFHPQAGAPADRAVAVDRRTDGAGEDPAAGHAGSYSIAIPPPNVTGTLHMGHALNNTIQDVLIRYHRMRGERTKWILGTDHAGIATQAQVEKSLRAEGLSRQELGREEFLARVWRWREHYGHRIVEQLKRLGASCDYAEERFTLDEAYARAVSEAFVALYDKGYVYRDRYIVNWDPGSQSAISDLEVQAREETDTLYSIRYELEGGGQLTIATVRPETMLADTAVAVNPDDERYRGLVGRTAILPLVGRRLPVIADPYVKVDFGTGQLKVTPAHDPNDFEIGRRHGLEVISVIGEDGRMTAEAGERFAGLTVAQAQAAVVSALEQEGRIAAREPYRHEVPYSHRSGARIEPLISLQWFMDMRELARPAVAAVEDGRVRIVPESPHKRQYLSWMSSIRPWCISRQLWWGHRLPVYYCERCERVQVAATPPECCASCGGALRRDEDVLDTWFSSALWPFATLGWPERTPELAAFYPTSALSTARDILFLWVARMIMMGLEFTGEVPFAEVYIHSVIQAPDGRRMSKSLGTGIDPLEEIEAHGADAVRFGLLAMSSSQDVRYSEEKVKQGQALANKLYNATRFVLGSLDGAGAPVRPGGPGDGEQLRTGAVEDRWILSRLQRVKAQTVAQIEAYDFSHAALGLYDFIYGELCDWYLELVKPRLVPGHETDRVRESGGPGAPAGGVPRGGPEAADRSAPEEDRRAVLELLVHVLSETLALAHPAIPFVTEELWSHLGGEGLLAAAPYPRPRTELIDEAAEAELDRAIEAIVRVRGWRERAGAAPGTVLPARLRAEGYERTAGAVARLARLELSGAERERGPSEGQRPVVASVPVPGGSVELLSAGGLDLAGLEERRRAARARIEREMARTEAKLASGDFLAKAPPQVVAGVREKLSRLTAELEAL